MTMAMVLFAVAQSTAADSAAMPISAPRLPRTRRRITYRIQSTAAIHADERNNASHNDGNDGNIIHAHDTVTHDGKDVLGAKIAIE